MREKHSQKGAATLLFMMLLTIIAVLLLTASYSRLLLALRRSVSAGDRIVSTYAAESRINDLIARLINGYPFSFPFSYDETIGDTSLEIRGREEGANQIVEVTANRNFASSKIRATRVHEVTTATVNRAEIILALDCTGSMTEPASPGASTTRMQELKRATLAFLDTVAESPHAENYDIGIGVFTLYNAWLRTSSGVEITPGADIPLATIRDTVNTQFGVRGGPSGEPYHGDSIACNTGRVAESGSTSIGSGFALANEYFRSVPAAPDTHRIVILITDGVPNRRMVYGRCTPSYSCPGNCIDDALGMFRCTITPTTQNWKPGESGDRDPNTDVYGILVMQEPPSGHSEYDQFLATQSIFETQATEYFNVENATELTGVLESIFETISEGVGAIRIEKIVPGL